jgi:hypothetical protein
MIMIAPENALAVFSKQDEAQREENSLSLPGGRRHHLNGNPAGIRIFLPA